MAFSLIESQKNGKVLVGELTEAVEIAEDTLGNDLQPLSKKEI